MWDDCDQCFLLLLLLMLLLVLVHGEAVCGTHDPYQTGTESKQGGGVCSDRWQ